MRFKVLLSAYTCEPNKGSESGIGWNWIRQVSKYNDVWVITRINNRKAIEENLNQLPLNKVKWIFFDLPYYLRFWKKGSRGSRLYYYFWQIAIYFKIKKINSDISFDIIHHVTFGTYWFPSLLSILPPKFVWGPIGGGESPPKELYKSLNFIGKLFEYKRDFIRSLVNLDLFLRLTSKNTAIALATSEQTKRSLENLGAKKVRIMSNVALSDEDIFKLKDLKVYQNSRTIFISIGRLIHWKGYHFAIKAYAKLDRRINDSEYWLVGEGSEYNNLFKLVKELKIEDKVKFLGNVSRGKVFELLSNSNILLHPSLHDSGGWVCAEAMTAGKPVICLDIGGPSIQVSDNTGIKIRPTNELQIINDLYNAMYLLAKDIRLYNRMSKAGIERINRYFSWNKRGEEIQNIYNNLMLSNRNK